MAQYKCFTQDFEVLDKKIRRIIKKLDRYNLGYTYNILNETIETVGVYNANRNGKEKAYDVNLSVTNYEFEMESLKLGKYEVVAILDHTTQNMQCDNNMVYISNADMELPEHYYTARGDCQHCNSNRRRNKTAILYCSDTKEYKQVGITCLKEYTGIDCIDVIRNFTDIHDIINDINKCEVEKGSLGRYKHYVSTIDYLARCIYCINKDGYIKEGYTEDITKYAAWDQEAETDARSRVIADNVITFFKESDFHFNTFMTNIQTALLQENICYANGFIAYAYVAYKKELKKLEEIEEKRGNQVGYFGEIGKRETLTNLKVECVTSYSNYFGYREVTTHIYKMTDESGFVFIWRTQNYIESDFVSELKGTIKAHAEYNGELQTELTRCKVVA